MHIGQVMKLSIIIPVYNSKNTIERCLESIFSQGIEDLQVIVVDDYSVDASYLKCQEIQENYENLELYQTDGKGVSAARNTGLRHVIGDVVGFCDADDYFEKDAFSTVLQEFEADKELDLCCFGFYYRENGKVTAEKKSVRRRVVTTNKMFEKILCDENIMGSVWNKFYRRDILSSIFFDEKLSYCEDTHYNALVLTRYRKAKCLLINIPLYNYVQTSNSATHDVAKMFNQENQLKYNESMYHIAQDCVLTRMEKRSLKRAIYKLSVCQYYKSGLDNEKKKKLKEEIKDSIIYFAFYFYKFGIKGNVKLLLLGLKALIVRE